MKSKDKDNKLIRKKVHKGEVGAGRLVIISGASQSGKTHYARHSAAMSSRCIVWDPEDQWSQLPGFRKVNDRRELLKLVMATKGQLRVAFVAGGDLRGAFDFWSRCAFYWGRFLGPCTVIAEELADVSTPAKASGSWGVLVRRGLKRGITIYAISQRWAEADKTAIGNASCFVIFRSTPEDTVYMAKKTGAPYISIAGLHPRQFIEVDALTWRVSGRQTL